MIEHLPVKLEVNRMNQQPQVREETQDLAQDARASTATLKELLAEYA